MSTGTLITVEQFHALPDDGNRYELNRGVLVTMPRSKQGQNQVIQNLNAELTPYVRARGMGEVYSKSGYELDGPRLFRVPDVSFLRADRVGATLEDQYPQGAPDLAVEVVGSSNSAEDLAEKIGQYFQFGSHSVWVIYPKTSEIYVYTDPSSVRIFRVGETLRSDLFPGWELPVARLM